MRIQSRPSTVRAQQKSAHKTERLFSVASRTLVILQGVDHHIPLPSGETDLTGTGDLRDGYSAWVTFPRVAEARSESMTRLRHTLS